ncbi:aminoacyl-tRNA hydrolase [soil metagenome]
MKYSTGKLQSLRARFSRSGTPSATPEEANLKAIIGLGNPGQKYAHTRHNLGFMVVDELVRQLQAGMPRDRFRAQVWETRANDERIALIKPQTYMNLSGASVQQVRNWYKLSTDEMLVVYDDVDLDFGVLRMKMDGGAGGHNGLASIIDSLGAGDVPRLRIGIGRGRTATTAHVLSGFSGPEEAQLAGVIKNASHAAMLWLQEGPVSAMNHVNQRPKPPKSAKTSPGDHEGVTPKPQQNQDLP